MAPLGYGVCRLYQSHLKDSHDKIRSRAAVAKLALSTANKAGSGKESGLRAAILVPLSSSQPNASSQAGL